MGIFLVVLFFIICMLFGKLVGDVLKWLLFGNSESSKKDKPTFVDNSVTHHHYYQDNRSVFLDSKEYKKSPN